jgi:hypothetical protein
MGGEGGGGEIMFHQIIGSSLGFHQFLVIFPSFVISLNFEQFKKNQF